MASREKTQTSNITLYKKTQFLEIIETPVVKYRDDFSFQDLKTTIAKFTLEISISFHQVS